jgi:pilus assembly protein Flp/PilA
LVANIRRFVGDEEGATAMEYALMAAAIAGVIVAIAFLLGTKVKNSLSTVATHF